MVVKRITKKQKFTVLFAGLVAICSLAMAGLYFTGVYPKEGKGASPCYRFDCPCHTEETGSFGATENVCGRCSECKKLLTGENH